MNELEIAEIMFTMIGLTYQGAAFAAQQIASALATGYALTPETWPAPWRLGVMSMAAGLLYGAWLVVKD